MEKFVCIGVPYEIGQFMPESPVFAVEKSGFAAQIGAPWITVKAKEETVLSVNEAIAKAIQNHPNHTPLIFAEDCISSIGAVDGVNLPDLGVIWFDAHGDFNTPETSPSGYLGGMPLAILVGRGNQDLMPLPPLLEKNIIVTDARNLDPEEDEALHASHITHLTQVRDLVNYALPSVPLYIHLDTDVIDPSLFPAVGYPEPNGASLEDMYAALDYVAQHGKVAAFLITIWNHEDGADNEAHLALVLKLVRRFIGDR